MPISFESAGPELAQRSDAAGLRRDEAGTDTRAGADGTDECRPAAARRVSGELSHGAASHLLRDQRA